jgi:hypothetical protein
VTRAAGSTLSKPRNATCVPAWTFYIWQAAHAENKLMAFHLRSLAVPAIALSIGAMLATNAQAVERYHHKYVVAQHHRIHHSGDRLVSRGDDVVVHTGRSYLDPGTSANEGTESRYFYDTAHVDFREEGPDFTRNVAGFERLPGPYSLPGRRDTVIDLP